MDENESFFLVWGLFSRLWVRVASLLCRWFQTSIQNAGGSRGCSKGLTAKANVILTCVCCNLVWEEAEVLQSFQRLCVPEGGWCVCLVNSALWSLMFYRHCRQEVERPNSRCAFLHKPEGAFTYWSIEMICMTQKTQNIISTSIFRSCSNNWEVVPRYKVCNPYNSSPNHEQELTFHTIYIVSNTCTAAHLQIAIEMSSLTLREL